MSLYSGLFSRKYGNEENPKDFPAPAYSVKGYDGIAFYVRGWEIDDMEERTGRVVVTMVGDDKRHNVEPSDLTPLTEGSYCSSCGQIGCTHGG
jgi:hypothetical protein